jgi:hypothetical protein
VGLQPLCRRHEDGVKPSPSDRRIDHIGFAARAAAIESPAIKKGDAVPTTLTGTCPLCGLRFSGMPLLELHIREDHRRPRLTGRTGRATRMTGTRQKINQNPLRKRDEATGIMAKALIGHASECANWKPS